MCKVISISNQKGGVGKTTTTGALAAGMKRKGSKVLAIDLDPQGNLTFSVEGDSEISASIYDVLKGEVKAQHSIQRLGCTDLISSSILLSSVELEYTASGREYLLRDAIAPLHPYYDYILIDTPPNLGILTVNAFTASDYIIVPVLSDIFSLQGLAQLHDSVQRIKTYCNPKLEYAGILLTRFNTRTLVSAEIQGTAQMLSKSLDIPLFRTCIRNSIVVNEAQIAQKSLFSYAPQNGATKDYGRFVDELHGRGI